MSYCPSYEKCSCRRPASVDRDRQTTLALLFFLTIPSQLSTRACLSKEAAKGLRSLPPVSPSNVAPIDAIVTFQFDLNILKTFRYLRRRSSGSAIFVRVFSDLCNPLQVWFFPRRSAGSYLDDPVSHNHIVTVRVNILQQFLDEINMGHEHAPTAVSLAAQLIHRLAI